MKRESLKKKSENSNRIRLFLIIFAFCLSPHLSFGLSETELESLETTGKKSLSISPWRTQVGFALQRNIEFNSRFSDDTGADILRKFFNPRGEASLFDLWNLYYGLTFNFNYSLKEMEKKYILFKNVELFVNSSFQTPVKGYHSGGEADRGYGLSDYIHYGLGDITAGLTAPIYRGEGFFSDFSVSLMPYPLSRFSQGAGLSKTVSGAVSFLYFLEKEKLWSLAVSSNHSLNVSYYHKNFFDREGHIENFPLETAHSGSLIYRQSHQKYMPTSVRASAGYFLGVSKKKINFYHDLLLALSFSWKMKERYYLNCSIRWKYRVNVYNFSNKSIRKDRPIRWFEPSNYVFSIGSSYTF